MRAMLAESVLPGLRRLRKRGRETALRYLICHGMREAEIAERLGGLEGEVRFGTRARHGTITIRIEARAGTPEEAAGRAEAAASQVRRRLGEAVVGEGDRGLAELAAEVLLRAGLKVALAESCTGGLIAARLVAVPGMSASLVEGVVAYSNEAKARRLGVPEDLIRRKGAVSAEVARAMAEGARKEAGADLSVAVTGVAGPGGGTEEKPVGLVHVASASELATEAVERRFRGGRDAVRKRAAEEGLWLLLREARRLEASRRARPPAQRQTG
jgi:nicotinamide-nucleotide amidase